MRTKHAPIILALALVATPAMAQTQTTVTRDRFGREVFTTTRTRDSVVVRDRFGRELGTETVTTRRPRF